MIGSVLIYCLCLGAPTILLFPYALSRERPSFGLLLFAYLPTAFFAAVRGDVGTDTATYRAFFKDADASVLIGVEPLFRAFVLVIRQMSSDSQLFLIAQAFTCWFLYALAAHRLERNGPLFSFALLPALMVDSTFNGMRYGLAYATAALALSFNAAHRGWQGRILRSLPGLIHLSMWIMLVDTLWFACALAVLAVILVGYIDLGSVSGADYFIWKYGEYESTQKPSWYSGLMPAIQLIFLLAIGTLKRPPSPSSEQRRWPIFLGSALCLTGLAISGVTYAGLRIATLGVFLLTLGLTVCQRKEDWNPTKTILLAIISLLTSANLLRQFIQLAGSEAVKFIPYSSHWDVW